MVELKSQLDCAYQDLNDMAFQAVRMDGWTDEGGACGLFGRCIAV